MIDDVLTFLPQSHPWQQNIHWFDTIDSTNTRAKEMALQGAPHGTVLLAGHQTAGRGRMGRSFQSPMQMGIYMSVLLRLPLPATQFMHLTCAAAVAACDAVQSVTGMRPGIKWTNDLVCGGRKIAGILTELITTPTQCCAIIGIGINCHQKPEDFSPEIRSFAGSLAMTTQKNISRPELAAALVESLARMDQKLLTQKAECLVQYGKDCITIGQEVSILRADTVRHGKAIAIDDDGGLIVLFPDGHRESVSSGEVSIRGLYGYIS